MSHGLLAFGCGAVVGAVAAAVAIDAWVARRLAALNAEAERATHRIYTSSGQTWNTWNEPLQ